MNKSSSQKTLTDLFVRSVSMRCTLIVCKDEGEAARWLETFKTYEKKPVEAIIGKKEGKVGGGSGWGGAKTVQDIRYQDYVEAVTTVHSINVRDAKMLVKELKTPKEVFNVGMEEGALIDGVGGRKIRRLVNVFRKPW